MITIPGGRLAIIMTAGALCVLTACAKNDGPKAGAKCPRPQGITSVGEEIPADCTLELLGGGTLRLGDLKGKPAVINFWAAWCTFCIAEMPQFQKAYAAFGDRVSFIGADLIGIQGETKGVAKTFAAKTGVRYPLVYDTGAVLYGHFSAQLVMPVTIFVRSNGVVAFRQFGPLTEAKIRELARTKLGVV